MKSLFFSLPILMTHIYAAEWNNEIICGRTPIGALPTFTIRDNGTVIKHLSARSRRQSIDQIVKPMIVYSIIGGIESVQFGWPWAVKIEFYVPNFSSSQDRMISVCTGSLINENFVLTALHCVNRDYDDSTRLEDVNPGIYFKLYFGKLNKYDPNGRECKIALQDNIIRHPSFDLALIKLNKDCILSDIYGITIRPICLPHSTIDYRNDPSVYGRDVIVIGWGVISQINNIEKMADQLMETIIDLKNTKECFKIWSDIGALESGPGKLVRKKSSTNELICAGRKGHDTCGGDSGGPLMSYINNKWYLMGVTSIGTSKCALEGVPAFYVHVPSAIDWLVKNAKNN